jgi:hypothetical protein
MRSIALRVTVSRAAPLIFAAERGRPNGSFGLDECVQAGAAKREPRVPMSRSLRPTSTRCLSHRRDQAPGPTHSAVFFSRGSSLSHRPDRGAASHRQRPCTTRPRSRLRGRNRSREPVPPSIPASHDRALATRPRPPDFGIASRPPDFGIAGRHLKNKDNRDCVRRTLSRWG